MRFRLFLLSLFISIQCYSQASYSRVKVHFNEDQTIVKLAQLGIAIDHGHYAKGKYFTGDLSAREIEQINYAGFELEILIDDLEKWYADPNRKETSFQKNTECIEISPLDKYPIPQNFEYGEMGGFFTWQEMLSILDDMKSQYPHLISTKTPIEGELSFEGRPIHWVRISDNPELDEQEDEILYTALHHAREPAGLSQLIYYMWYLLENYESDEQIQYLVNNTAMYFIPCVNPDGYVYNEWNNPGGGGLWRKNRMINGDGSHGIDLNRNYGFQWGYDDIGSSNNPLDETYRGPEAFSEPETRALKQFCNDHQFKIALNYHTHGNLLIHPWGFSNAPTEEHPTFYNMSTIMTAENHYESGTGSETVGYAANGVADDWMYGEQTSKPSIYSFAPEVGAFGGFWPTIDQIIPICRESLPLNLNAAALLLQFGQLKDLTSKVINNQESSLDFQLKRIGLQDGQLTVSLLPISEHISFIEPEKTFELDLNESIDESFSLTLTPGIQNGDTILFELQLSNDHYTQVDTLQKIFIDSPPLFADDFSTDFNWDTQLGNWNITSTTFHSANSSMTDSPNGIYGNDIEEHLMLSPSLIIDQGFEKALLYFWAKWDIEQEYDYAQLTISVNGDEFFPVCGKYSSTGTENQDEGQPIYDGYQQDWIQEEIDITDFVEFGDEVQIRFSMYSDGYIQEDGFYLDDLELYLVNNDPSDLTAPAPKSNSWTISPNLANPETTVQITFNKPLRENGEMIIYNSIGQKMESIILEKGKQQINYTPNLFNSGLFYCRMKNPSGTFPVLPIYFTNR